MTDTFKVLFSDKKLDKFEQITQNCTYDMTSEDLEYSVQVKYTIL